MKVRDFYNKTFKIKHKRAYLNFILFPLISGTMPQNGPELQENFRSHITFWKWKDEEQKLIKMYLKSFTFLIVILKLLTAVLAIIYPNNRGQYCSARHPFQASSSVCLSLN